MKRNCPSGLRKPLVFQQGSDWPAKHLDGRGVQTEASPARTAGQVAVYRKTTAKDVVVVDPWSDHPRAALHDPLSWELKSNICSPLFTVCFYLTGLIVLHYILLFFIKKEKNKAAPRWRNQHLAGGVAIHLTDATLVLLNVASGCDVTKGTGRGTRKSTEGPYAEGPSCSLQCWRGQICEEHKMLLYQNHIIGKQRFL